MHRSEKCHFLLQCMESLSCVRLSATTWALAYQAPPSMVFSRREYWSGLPLPSPMYLFLIIDFICLFEFCLCWVFTAACGFSLVVMRGGYFLVAVNGLHTVVASLVAEHRLSGTWASVVVARGCSN